MVPVRTFVWEARGPLLEARVFDYVSAVREFGGAAALSKGLDGLWLTAYHADFVEVDEGEQDVVVCVLASKVGVKGGRLLGG
jgi:hypothetical protein